EKLFEGEKLFLSPEQGSPWQLKDIATQIIGWSCLSGALVSSATHFKRFLLGSASGVLWTVAWLRNVFVVMATKSRVVLIRMRFGSDGSPRESIWSFKIPLLRSVKTR